jgi:hypothetical protein
MEDTNAKPGVHYGRPRSTKTPEEIKQHKDAYNRMYYHSKLKRPTDGKQDTLISIEKHYPHLKDIMSQLIDNPNMFDDIIQSMENDLREKDAIIAKHMTDVMNKQNSMITQLFEKIDTLSLEIRQLHKPSTPRFPIRNSQVKPATPISSTTPDTCIPDIHVAEHVAAETIKKKSYPNPDNRLYNSKPFLEITSDDIPLMYRKMGFTLQSKKNKSTKEVIGKQIYHNHKYHETAKNTEELERSIDNYITEHNLLMSQ